MWKRASRKCVSADGRFRNAGYRAVDKICDYFTQLEKRPVAAQGEHGFLQETLPGASRTARPC